MATQWSGEQVVAEYGDLQANSLAVDCLGIWAILAGRKALMFVDLSNPTEKVVKHPRNSKWNINCVQWNPHPSHAHHFVSACNQRLDLYSWKNEIADHICSMKSHSRTVSDVDWSPFDVNVIASCSVDTFTHLWDIRDPKKPSASFTTVAGATQVKWNKVTNNLFATTHEGDLRIWDPRKSNTPLQYIAAHLSKIHGLDWSPVSETCLATSSQDNTVKIWDTTNPRQSKVSLNPGSPVWRARYTSSGQGLVTTVVPQLRRGDNSLYLWNISNNSQPVHQFVGHHDVILEFQWRKQPEGSRDIQLVTWSKDHSLRIWKIDPQLQRLCGHEVDYHDSSENESTLSYDIPKTENGQDRVYTDQQLLTSTSPDVIPGKQPCSLQQEFDLVNINIPNITVEEMDIIRRTCTVTAQNFKFKICLSMYFPTNYPNNASPTFDFTNSTISIKVQQRLNKLLTETSQKNVRRNTNCLEPCLRQLALFLDNLSVEDRRTPDSEPYGLNQTGNKSIISPFSTFGGALQDINIPFPRTSGAKFCCAGYLVVFGRSKEAKKGPTGSELTPKALSDLTNFAANKRIRSAHSSGMYPPYTYSRSPPASSSEFVSISNYYYREKPPSRQYAIQQILQKSQSRTKDSSKSKYRDVEKGGTKKPSLGSVKIYDSACLLPISRYLGQHYIINTEDIPAMCRHNASAASTVGRQDLVKVWSLVSHMSDRKLSPSDNPNDGSPWARHPFGRKMLKAMMDSYRDIFDVQTLAMLCCVFWKREDMQKKTESIPQSSSTNSIDYMPPNSEGTNSVSVLGSSTDSGWNMLPAVQLKLKRSNSWSYDESFEDYKFDDERTAKEKESEKERKLHETQCRMLDPTAYQQYDEYLRAYANILYHWGLRNQSKHVMNYVTVSPEPHRGVEFSVSCHYCRKDVRGAQCGSCKYPAFNCSICHLGVKGASNFCLTCGHGGHASHMLEWFKEQNTCPTGCGCKCLQGKTYITNSID